MAKNNYANGMQTVHYSSLNCVNNNFMKKKNPY